MGDYYFGITVGEKGNKLILCPRDMKQTADKTIDLQIENSKMYAALDNELFYLIGKEVCVKNLVTDESMAYDYTDIMSQVYADEIAEAESRVGQTYLNKNTNEYFVMEYRDPVPTVTNFTVTGNTIWISDYNGYLYSRNRETGDTAVYQVAEEYTIEALYTDGENLYIADSFEVVRALTGEAKKNEEGIYILKTEPLVK